MTDTLVVLVPVLARPHRVQPTLDAFTATVPHARVLFVGSPGDEKEQEALEAAGADAIWSHGSYPAKILAGVASTSEQLIFTAADDIVPQHGWFEAAAGALTGRVEVVGVNDMIQRTRRPDHATHFLMTRKYAELPCLDGSPGPFSQAYFHWRCDDELIATARHRRVYAYAPEAYVRHEHPMTGQVPDDDTYALGRSRVRQDNRAFVQREHLWK